VVTAASKGRSEKSLICKYPRQPNSSPHKVKVEKREVIRRPIGMMPQTKDGRSGMVVSGDRTAIARCKEKSG
jgi:hypothetical protein